MGVRGRARPADSAFGEQIRRGRVRTLKWT
jgi:hypothetical protein